MATDKAQPGTADTSDMPAEIAEIRQEILDLIADRESLQADNDTMRARLDALESAPASAGGVAPAAVERELAKLRRPLAQIAGDYFRNVAIEPAAPLVDAPPPAAPVTDGGATVGATSVPSDG